MTPPAADTDARLTLRRLDQRYDLPHFESKRQWEARARELRTHLLAVNGLLPRPEAPPLRAQVFGTAERGGYAVSKVFFQSHPGLVVTGNLFVPRGKKGPFPAVLNPHGHWQTGRFADEESGTVLGRGVSFARQGYVAFCYDMIGYNDSWQLPHRQESDRQRLWGFSHMSLQLYNSIRAVDFLQSLKEVDPERIGCTGESGGGTQTYLLMAVEDRIKVAAPVVMVSARYQGGCVCENAPSLRVDTINPEVAALMAPRPLLLVSCTGDWTVEVPTYEYPFIRGIYDLYHATDRVASVQMDADHNYNLDSRNAVYPFFAKWLLGDDDPERFVEQPYRLDSKDTYLVFADRAHPAWAPEGEKLLDKLTRARRRQVRSLLPESKREVEPFREQLAPAMAHLLMATAPAPREVKVIRREARRAGDVRFEELVLSRPAVGDRVFGWLVKPSGRPAGVTLIASPVGKAGLLDPDTGEMGTGMSDFLKAGLAVLAVDCWGQGEAATPPERDQQAAEIHHYLTYNRSDDANRIQDILTALGWLRTQSSLGPVHLVGMARAGLWALLARTQAPFVSCTVADLMRVSDDDSFLANARIPAIRNLGDLTTAAALVAPGALCLHNAGKALDIEAAAQAYRAAGAAKALRVETARLLPRDWARFVTARRG
jgi:dienelactone hydrolase